MDVSGWTIDQKMRLPDWCFGNRKVLCVCVGAEPGPKTNWFISRSFLPAEICVWQINWFPRKCEHLNSYIRFGFRMTRPTSEAEMNTSTPILPDFGDYTFTPPKVYLTDIAVEVWGFDLRKGMSTGGMKVAVEIHTVAGAAAGNLTIVYSGFPTSMAGWMAHNK